MGEYIEREKAYNAIVKNYGTDAQLRDLDAILAADVVPVVHGRWIKYKSWLECSVCGYCFDFEASYCPDCGAKMTDGDEE